MAREVPCHKFVVSFGAEKAPRHDATGINEVLYKVVGLGDGIAFECGRWQIVQAFKAAALQQFSQAALQRHFKTGVRAERGKHTTCAWVHQRHTHHRVGATQ